MLINQLKELGQVTIIYSENDKEYLSLVLSIARNTHYIESYEFNKSYTLKKRKVPRIPRRKNNEKNNYTGVFKKGDKYIAQISVKGKNKYLGSFEEEEDADKCRNDYIEKNKIIN